MIEICFSCKKERKGIVYFEYVDQAKVGTLTYNIWKLPRCCCPDYIYYRTDEDRDI